MKSFALFSIAALSLSASAGQLPDTFFTPGILVKEIVSRGNLMPGPDLPRRVHTELTFVVESCRKVSEEDFELLVKTENRATLGLRTSLSIAYKKPFIDCMGPVHETELRLETLEVPPYGLVAVTNPLLRKTDYAH